jgi:Holliday junction resolvasome RuvABC endonuclease subunit
MAYLTHLLEHLGRRLELGATDKADVRFIVVQVLGILDTSLADAADQGVGIALGHYSPSARANGL